MSVLLPAPFSPTTAWTSPTRASRSTSSKTGTPKKVLVMARIWRRGGAKSVSAALGLTLSMGHRLTKHAVLYRPPNRLVNALALVSRGWLRLQLAHGNAGSDPTRLG